MFLNPNSQNEPATVTLAIRRSPLRTSLLSLKWVSPLAVGTRFMKIAFAIAELAIAAAQFSRPVSLDAAQFALLDGDAPCMLPAIAARSVPCETHTSGSMTDPADRRARGPIRVPPLHQVAAQTQSGPDVPVPTAHAVPRLE